LDSLGSSGGHRGKPIAILVDGRVVTAPVVKYQFSEGAWIQGNFSPKEAERIAKGLAGKK
jgi:preprotein translocase subunit SecD